MSTIINKKYSDRGSSWLIYPVLSDKIQKQLMMAQDIKGAAKDQVKGSFNAPVFHGHFLQKLQLQFPCRGPDGEDRDAKPRQDGFLDRFRTPELGHNPEF
jgi:hypothetical protein